MNTVVMIINIYCHLYKGRGFRFEEMYVLLC